MQTSTEIEAKFPVSGLTGLDLTLQDLGARLLAPRYLERNWQFDTPEGELSRSGRVLRVREGGGGSMTYKEKTGQRLTRREIEFNISSSAKAAELLEALGYRVILVYEKYRQVYSLDNVEVMLDEVPLGSFVEIEGPGETAIMRAADRLGLAREAGIDLSYMAIFEQLRRAAGLEIPNLTFSDFEGYELDTMALLGLRDALVPGEGTG